MALPTSGSLSIKDAAGEARSIALEVDGNLIGDKSLSALSTTASFPSPYHMTDFYGYSSLPDEFDGVGHLYNNSGSRCLVGSFHLRCSPSGVSVCCENVGSVPSYNYYFFNWDNIPTGCYYFDFSSICLQFASITTYCWDIDYGEYAGSGTCTPSFPLFECLDFEISGF